MRKRTNGKLDDGFARALARLFEEFEQVSKSVEREHPNVEPELLDRLISERFAQTQRKNEKLKNQKLLQ